MSQKTKKETKIHASMGYFPCFKCGCCCRHVGQVKELKQFADRTGTCRYLDPETNECQIYDTDIRPIVCSVWDYYQRHFSKEVTWDDYVFTNMLNCVLVRYLDGVEEPNNSPFKGQEEAIARKLIQDRKDIAKAKKGKKKKNETKND